MKIMHKMRQLVPELFLIFKNAFLRLKQVVSTLVLIYFGRPPLRHTIKKKEDISDCLSRKTNFYFSQKGLGLSSTPHFVFDFSGRTLLMIYSIN